MEYFVKAGDTLPRIAREQFGDETLWPEIARANLLEAPYRLVIGQGLFVPTGCDFETGLHCFGIGPDTNLGTRTGFFDHASAELGSDASGGAALVLARGALFVLADEVLPSKKVVRKVLMGAITDEAAYVAAHPEVFGLKPLAPASVASIGEHALGHNVSRFISASTLPGGAPNIGGRRVFIDVARAEAAGVRIHSSETIVADLARLAAQKPHLLPRVQKLTQVILKVEREVLLEGALPASAIKSSTSMTLTRSLRVVQVVGIAFTAYDLGSATIKSVKTESAAPIVRRRRNGRPGISQSPGGLHSRSPFSHRALRRRALCSRTVSPASRRRPLIVPEAPDTPGEGAAAAISAAQAGAPGDEPKPRSSWRPWRELLSEKLRSSTCSVRPAELR